MPGRNTNSADNVFMISLCVGLALFIVRVSGECDYPPEYQTAIMKDEHLTQGPPDFVEGFTINYKCQSGYVRKSGSPRITCTNSQWSNLTLVCDLVKCPDPPEIVNGKITNAPQGTVTFGTVIIYKCNEGILVGNKELVCTKYGNYSSAPPACKDHKGCRSVQVGNGRKVAGFGPVYKYKDSINFACNSGYILHGTDTVTCGINEIWEPELPTCQKEVPPTSSPGFIYVIVGLLIAVAVAVAVAVCCWFFKNRKGSYYTAEKYEMKLAVNDEQQNMNSDLSLKKSSSPPGTAAVY